MCRQRWSLLHINSETVGDITKSFDGTAGIDFSTADMGIITSDVNPIKSKEFTNVIATANDDNNGRLYFAKVQYSLYHLKTAL